MTCFHNGTIALLIDLCFKTLKKMIINNIDHPLQHNLYYRLLRSKFQSNGKIGKYGYLNNYQCNPFSYFNGPLHPIYIIQSRQKLALLKAGGSRWKMHKQKIQDSWFRAKNKLRLMAEEEVDLKTSTKLEVNFKARRNSKCKQVCNINHIGWGVRCFSRCWKCLHF